MGWSEKDFQQAVHNARAGESLPPARDSAGDLDKEIRCHHCRREFDAGIFKGPDELSHMYRTGEMTIWISGVNYDDGQAPATICARCLQKAAAEAETVSWDLVERESKPRVPHDG